MQRKFMAIAVLCAVVPFVSGCDRIDTYVEKLVDKLLAEKINTRLEAVEKQASEMYADNFELFRRVSSLESGSAIITTEATSYGIAHTEFGSFLVSCRSATPYLDGYKVKIFIGNLSQATFNDVVVTAKWGLPFDQNNFKAYLDSQKKKEITVVKVFPSGRYTEVELSLTPAKPEEVKRLEIALKFDRLSLTGPR